QQARNQAGNAGGIAAAGDADDRNAAAGDARKQAFDNRFADGLGLADGRTQMHEQAGAGIDFDNGAVLIGQRLGDVFGDDIHAGDVEPHDLGGEHRGGGVVRMDQVGDVGIVIAVAQDDDPGSGS